MDAGKRDEDAFRKPRSTGAVAGFAIASVVLVTVLLGLGTWQVERLFWKLDLIARVDARVHAPAGDPPARAEWAAVSAASDEYRHVRVAGTFLHHRSALTQAVTERGSGFWLMTPLQSATGEVVLINRGFVPSECRASAEGTTSTPGCAIARPVGEVEVAGLLRITEPGGGFLRSNDPASDRWYSRDVQAIAVARGLGDTAPYFIDAEATPGSGELPVGGLTVIAFPNSHLSYALTWYAMGLLLGGAALWVIRDELRFRRAYAPQPSSIRTSPRPGAG